LAPQKRASAFKLEKSVIKPHYLQMTFEKSMSVLELTPTERCARVQITFPEDATDRRVLLEFPGASSQVRISPQKQVITGFTRQNSGGIAPGFATYFAISFDSTNWSSYGVYDDFEVLETTNEYKKPPVAGAAAMPYGYEADGTELFVARVAHGGGVYCGKMRPAFGGCNYGFGGREVCGKEYEMLVIQSTEYKWATAANGEVPDGAVAGGREKDGTTIYVARTAAGGGMHVGSLRNEYGGCKVMFGGDELLSTEYEVLVADAADCEWIAARDGALVMRNEPKTASVGAYVEFGLEGGVDLQPFEKAQCPAGYEEDGALLYVARVAHGDGEEDTCCMWRGWRMAVVRRVAHGGGVHTGKMCPKFGGCHYGYGGREVCGKEYELLVIKNAAFEWVAAANGQVPAGAVEGGNEPDGTPIYVARAPMGGGMHVGKLREVFGGCNISFAGEEICAKEYQVLVS
jgi:hypothetical protein